MLIDFLIGLPVMALCLLTQSLLLLAALRFYLSRADAIGKAPLWSVLSMLNGVMVLLVIGNLAQVTIWAVLFRALGEFESLHEAVYHSAVNFSTLGYGDIVMSESNRFLGPLEAINGVLMIGVSTAALMSVFQDVFRRFRED